MSFHRAYYSILQFCPDRGRAEAVNLGVLLLCPDLGFAQAKTSRDLKRARKFFGARVDPARLLLIERGIEAQIAERFDWSEGAASLERLIATRANDIQLTAARPMKTADPQADLEALFAELVEERSAATVAEGSVDRIPQAIRLLDARFRSEIFSGRLKYDEAIEIPVLNTVLEIPYAYQNGALNLIKPQEFRGRAERVRRTASELAVEGDLLQRHSEGQRRQLIVVPIFQSSNQREAELVTTLFEQYNIRVVPTDKVDDFAMEVDRTAHL